MVTTSSQRGLTIPTVNSDGNIWGGELNTSLAALDSILGGTLTLQSSAAMSVTLSSSQAQMSRIVVQGQLASNFNLVFASSNFALGNYQVWNNSSAGTGGVICQTLGGGATCNVNIGTMRTINADGTNAQFADNQPGVSGVPGYINKFRNPAMDVFQRAVNPQPMTVSGINSFSYTLDGWIVGVASGTVNVTQAYNTFLSGASLKLQGVSAACLGLVLEQNVESFVAAQLAVGAGTVQPITVRYDIYNNSGAAVTPQLSTAYCNSSDNFSSVTLDLTPVNLQTCPNGAMTTIAYTFVPNSPTALASGYQFYLSFGNALNNSGGAIFVSHCDVRATPGVASGVNFSPPPPELRPIATEMLFCQRYLFLPTIGWWYVFFTASAGGQQFGMSCPFPVRMRAPPTLFNPSFTTSNCPTPNVSLAGGSGTDGWAFQVTSNGAGPVNAYLNHASFASEL